MRISTSKLDDELHKIKVLDYSFLAYSSRFLFFLFYTYSFVSYHYQKSFEQKLCENYLDFLNISIVFRITLFIKPVTFSDSFYFNFNFFLKKLLYTIRVH